MVVDEKNRRKSLLFFTLNEKALQFSSYNIKTLEGTIKVT